MVVASSAPSPYKQRRGFFSSCVHLHLFTGNFICHYIQHSAAITNYTLVEWICIFLSDLGGSVHFLMSGVMLGYSLPLSISTLDSSFLVQSIYFLTCILIWFLEYDIILWFIIFVMPILHLSIRLLWIYIFCKTFISIAWFINLSIFVQSKLSACFLFLFPCCWQAVLWNVKYNLVLPQVCLFFIFLISLFHILLACLFNKATHLLVDRSKAHTFHLLYFFHFCSFITNIKCNCKTIKGSEYAQKLVLRQ